MHAHFSPEQIRGEIPTRSQGLQKRLNTIADSDHTCVHLITEQHRDLIETIGCNHTERSYLCVYLIAEQHLEPIGRIDENQSEQSYLCVYLITEQLLPAIDLILQRRLYALVAQAQRPNVVQCGQSRDLSPRILQRRQSLDKVINRRFVFVEGH